jgi:hypothetical protein
MFTDQEFTMMEFVTFILEKINYSFYWKGGLNDFTKSVFWTDNAILTYKEKQFLLGHCYHNDI